MIFLYNKIVMYVDIRIGVCVAPVLIPAIQSLLPAKSGAVLLAMDGEFYECKKFRHLALSPMFFAPPRTSSRRSRRASQFNAGKSARTV